MVRSNRSRATNKISPERAAAMGLALPSCRPSAAASLVVRLRRLDGTAQLRTPDDDPLSPRTLSPRPVADIERRYPRRYTRTDQQFHTLPYPHGLRIDAWFVMFQCALAIASAASAARITPRRWRRRLSSSFLPSSFFLTMTHVRPGSYFFGPKRPHSAFIMLPLLLLGTYCIITIPRTGASAARTSGSVAEKTANKLQILPLPSPT